MICQICKDVLPFRLDDGTFYFERVEFLNELNNWHCQNYLALCPNHAAMFQHVNPSKDMMKEMFADVENSELKVILAQTDTAIYFTKTHIADLNAVIKADEAKHQGSSDCSEMDEGE